MKLRRFLEPDRDANEWEWWIVAVCFYLLGSVWGGLLIYKSGLAALPTIIGFGIVLAALGFAVGRLSRYAARVVRRRSDIGQRGA